MGAGVRRSYVAYGTAEDYVIATGETNSLETFCAIVFEKLDLNWKDHITIDKELYRPSEIMMSLGDSSYARSSLGWQAKTKLSSVIVNMINEELQIR